MGRGGNLDLPALRQFAITRNNAGNEFAYQVEQAFAVFVVEALIPAHHVDEHVMFAAHTFAAPHQVVPDQQVGHVLSGQVGQRRIAAGFELP